MSVQRAALRDASETMREQANLPRPPRHHLNRSLSKVRPTVSGAVWSGMSARAGC